MGANVIELRTGRKKRQREGHWPTNAGYCSTGVNQVEAMREMTLLFDRTLGEWVRRGWKRLTLTRRPRMTLFTTRRAGTSEPYR